MSGSKVEPIAENEIYDYLLLTKEAIRDNIGNPIESKRILIKFKGWFSKQKFNILSFIESTSMGQRVLNMKDMRLVVISELDKVFNGMRAVSINRLDDDTLEDMMEDLADFFDCINLDGFKSENYEISTNLSSNLMALLGMAPAKSKDTSASTWSAPSAPGLQNSDRIIPQKASSTAKPPQQVQKVPSPRNQQQKIVQPQPQPQQKNQTARLKSPPISSKSQISADLSKSMADRSEFLDHENSGDSSSRSSDDETVSSFGGSVFDEEKFSSLTMSASLRASLGLDATPVETDWKPPAASGVQNSKPIFVGKKPER